jgi:endonuclease YncB( thermonuclease family)
VRVDLGFGMEVEETVRLRGIDAPEMSQAEGEQARRFVDEALRATRRVVVATRQRDKYGRWLADLYYEPQTRSVRRMAREGRLLNRQLVAEGLAARYR